MKKILLVFIVLLSFQLSAQNAELEAFKDLFNSEKKTLLSKFMELDATEATAFWSIYDSYSLERKEIANRRISFLERYIEQYDSLTDDQADALVTESFSIRDKNEKIQKKYYKKIKKILGATKASQFVQFERYVQTAIDQELQSALPLIGEQ